MGNASIPTWWQGWMAPAIVLVLVGALWRLIRPALTRAGFQILCSDPGRVRRMIFDSLETKDGQIKFRAYTLEVFADRVNEVDDGISEALEIAQSNKDALMAIREIQNLHGGALRDVQASVKDLPQLADSLQRLSRSMEAFASEMSVVNKTMVRLEERSDIERRMRQEVGGPRRRETDHKGREEP